MARLAPGGRIALDSAKEEISRLQAAWQAIKADEERDSVSDIPGEKEASALDRFDRVQFDDVLKICRSSRSLSEAGRVLFQSSRKNKQSSNDTDRLSKYLSKFNLRWSIIGK